jgi:predicted kinase
MKKFCKIMRGVPGTGKTTWAKLHCDLSAPTVKYISADVKRMVGGHYLYDKDKDPAIHAECLREAVDAFQRSHPIVIIDNTNIRSYEFSPYYKLAEAYGYEVEIVHCVAEYEMCLARNEHKVPPAIIKSMMCSSDPVPPWWNYRVITHPMAENRIHIGGVQE